jgi:type IV pilus assembly protein PilB
MTRLFGSILVEKYHIDQDVLNAALLEAKQTGVRLGECLITEYGVSEVTIYKSMAEQFDLPFITDIRSRINHKRLRELPVELFNEGRCFPINEREDMIGIAIFDPMDLDIIMDVEYTSGMKVEVFMTTPSEMENVWESLYKGESFFRNAADQISEEYEKQMQDDERRKTLTKADILKRMESEPVVKMVNLLFSEAIKQSASDIHIEPTEAEANVRFRIHGLLQHHTTMSRWMCIPVTSRIKIMADLDIAEKRIPQDGRIAHEENGDKFDFRVSTLPTQYGEKTVIRVLRHDRKLLDLTNIGLPERELKIISELIDKPQGMFFVTGPTGSGKSTALFACLNTIRHKAINITTIENPIEYKLEGITQVQVNEKAGLNFATTLRSILRQDPDMILIGEIRDKETAEIAMQSAQTGHLVFSTLHTNDAVAAVSRLKDLGIQPFLIASSLLGIMGQRLVRTLCAKCKRKAPVTEQLARQWVATLGEMEVPKFVYKAQGCKFCNKNGYSGRTGIYELAVVNDATKTLITEDTPEIKLRKAFREHGMRTMAEHGLELVKQGITSPEELLRVVAIDEYESSTLEE